MNQNPKDAIVKILEIINFTEDKEIFAKKFLDLCQHQAISDLIKSLPEDKQNQLQSSLSQNSNPEYANQVLQQTFSEAELKEALKKATEKVFRSYTDKVAAVLNDQQKSDLQTYLQAQTP